MTTQQVATTTTTFPTGSRVVVHIEVSAAFNISSEMARQRANRFLLMHLGDQLYAGEPELLVGREIAWRVPVHLSLSLGGYLGKVGSLRIDAQSGAIAVESPQTLEQIADYADVLYERATLLSTTIRDQQA